MGGLKSEYAAMRDSRFRRSRPGVTGVGSDADAHYENASRYTRMREYADAMVRDDGVTKFLVRRVVINTIRGGFGYEPDTGDKILDRDLKDRHEAWATDKNLCDVAGNLTFPEMEQLTVFAEIVAGDVFHVPTDEGAIQTFESHRCDTPRRSVRNIVHGIQLDDRRRRVNYFFKRETPGLGRRYDRVNDFHEIPAYDEAGNDQVFHVYDPMRFTQTRGVTAFHPIFDKAGLLEDIDFALLVKEQMAAFLAWEEQQTSEQPMPGVKYGSEEFQRQSDSTDIPIQEMSPGTIVRPAFGKKIVMHSSNINSAETMAHLKFTLQLLSVNLGLPLCVALLDGSETNFSGWRGAFDQAKLGFEMNQLRYEMRFHRPLANWRLRWWMSGDPALARAAERIGPRIHRHWWQKPRWPYIQPLQDAQANAVRLQTGQIALRDLHAENGGDFEQFVKDSVADNGLWIRAAMAEFTAVKQEFGDAIHDLTWRDFYHRDFYRGGQLIDTSDADLEKRGKPATAAQ